MNKKMLVLYLGIVLGVVSFGTSAMAVDFVDGWVKCTPATVGPADGLVAVKLINCSDGRSGWGQLDTAAGTDQMLATFLTAMSLQKDVDVFFQGTIFDNGATPFEYSKVKGLLLKN